MTKKVFLIAGEPSGDALGAALMREIRNQASEPVEFLGIGGPLMEEQGLASLVPMDQLSVMGIWEVIWQISRLIKLISGVVDEIEKAQPDIVITIDLPDFNFEVARRLKKREAIKSRIVHYVAPSVWAWRPGRARKIAGYYDGILCLFPFEPPYFQKYGLKAKFVGHPLIESTKDYDGGAFREKNAIAQDDLTLGLFLGSREAELESLSAILKEATQVVKEQYPDLRIIVPTLPQFEYNVLKVLEDWGHETTVVSDPDLKWDAFAACDVALAVSGTVGLELAYIGIPHAIAYKTHPLTWLAIRLLVKVRYAHLANILLDKDVVPEYLQGKCNSLEIAKGLLKLLKSEEMRQNQIRELQKLPGLLGTGDDRTPSQKAAATVISMLK